jgi:hypothetical protein
MHQALQNGGNHTEKNRTPGKRRGGKSVREKNMARKSYTPDNLDRWLVCFLPVKAPFSVFASTLITIQACLAKAVEIAFGQLFLVNERADGLFEADITKR